MNKEQLEKIFDEQFKLCEFYGSGDCDYINVNYDVKSFIFKTIIPEVLKSIIPKESYNPKTDLSNIRNMIISNIKQKAKEQFNINL